MCGGGGGGWYCVPVLSCECQCARGWVGVTEVEQSLVIYVMCVRVVPLSLSRCAPPLLWDAVEHMHR